MAEAARILVVDDEEDMVATLRDILEVSGFEVDVASSGQEAIERCREQPPSCILMDVLMPGLNGIDAFEEIRRLVPEVSVVFMTANMNSEPIRQAIEASGVEVLAKPLDLERMLHLIGKECR